MTKKQEIKLHDLILFNFIFSSEEPTLGIVMKIENDMNFYKIYHVLSETGIEPIPATIINYDIIDKSVIMKN